MFVATLTDINYIVAGKTSQLQRYSESVLSENFPSNTEVAGIQSVSEREQAGVKVSSRHVFERFSVLISARAPPILTENCQGSSQLL
jgi:hypothetical protein